MSLLHDALKKAEQESLIPSESVMVDRHDVPESRPLRVYLLVSLVVCSLAVGAYFRFYKMNSKGVVSLPQPKNFATSTPLSSQAMFLKEEGVQKIKAGEYEEARKKFESLVLLEPRNAEAYNNLGLSLKKLGRNEEAFEQYRKALALEPNCSECLNNLGVLYMTHHDLTEAENHFQKAIQARLDYADPYFHLGLLQESRGDLSAAKASYQKFVALSQGVSAEIVLKVQNRIASLKTN